MGVVQVFGPGNTTTALALMTTANVMPPSFNRDLESNSFSLFTEAYAPLHAPIVEALCIFGIFANIINVIILTRPRMRNGPTNFLLCGLSGAQLCLLATFLTSSIYMLALKRHRLAVDTCAFEYKTLGWLIIMVVSVNLSMVFHTIALVHTSLLAMFRYLAVHYPNRHYATLLRAKRAVYVTYFIVPVVCTTFYVNQTLKQISPDELAMCPGWDPNKTVAYHSTYRSEFLTSYNFVVIAVIGKICPCLCLSLLSALLIMDMKAAEIRRLQMVNRRTIGGTDKKCVSDRESQRRQTTLMLLIIVIALILVELPQGILNLLSAFLGKQFELEVYIPVGEFFQMLTVFYSSVNFILYCSMSSQFRFTFRKTFCQWRIVKTTKLQQQAAGTKSGSNGLHNHSTSRTMAEDNSTESTPCLVSQHNVSTTLTAV